MVEIAIQKEFIEASSHYTKLQPPQKLRELWLIEGVIDVIDGNGYSWDSYEVKIIFPPNYPMDLPLLIETGKKIEREEDWHNNKYGACCLGTEAKLFREMSDGVTLKRWLDRCVVPYLANHKFRIDTGRYANGEFSHHEEGISENYQELFSLGGMDEVIMRIREILGIGISGKNALCFCGSGKKYKRCYLLKRAEHEMHVPIHVFKRDLDLLQKFFAQAK